MSLKVLFFIESLRSGGKERRLVELLIYLKQNTNYELRLVLTENEIHYSYVRDLDIPIDIIKRKYLKKDPSLFFRFYNIAKQFKPDIIHTWGTMSTFYAIPAKRLLKKPLLSNLIASAKKNYNKISLTTLVNYSNYKNSEFILSNSFVGLKNFGLANKANTKVIYNGVHLERFQLKINKEEIKKQLSINTPYIVIMVASFSKHKDYDLLLSVVKEITFLRNDVTFLGIGEGNELKRIQHRVIKERIRNVKLPGRRNDIEHLIAIADIGILFTFSEGISNAIIEYMALGKPVITTDTKGGSQEIIEDEKSGYIMQPNAPEIAKKINELINNLELMNKLGQRGKQIIEQKFSIERMGKEYINIYNKYNC